MKNLWLFLILILNAIFSFAVSATVKVHIQWEYKDFTSPVEIYELNGKPRLWETKSVASIKAAPIGQKIEGSVFSVIPGQSKRFALIVRNNTNSPQFFFAAPHVVHPVEHSLGFKFKCLCVNHAFKVGPKETWYRIVEFRLSKEFVGQELRVTHSIIGIDQQRAEAFSKVPVSADL